MKTVDVTVIGSCILCEFCNQELVDDWNSEYVTCLPIWASKGAKVNGEEISIGETSLKQHMVNTHVMEPFAYRKLLGLGTEHPTPLVARWDFTPDRYLARNIPRRLWPVGILRQTGTTLSGIMP